MASYLVPPLYAAFVWWFSTGAVLLLVGFYSRFDLRAVSAAGLLVVSLYGLAASNADTSVTGAYVAFTCTILLWGAQEITFLAGWVTGPRPQQCPPNIIGWRRFGLALQAIVYHELMLLACGAAILFLTWSGANQVGIWTFAALWVLRQSAKINLFLGVPVTNDELMPDQVRFLKSFFAKKSVSPFFPLSVTLATAALVIMIQRLVEVSVTPFDIAGLTLVSTLFALGILEHWFMLLPLPALKLWGWGVKSRSSPDFGRSQASVPDGAAVTVEAHAEGLKSSPASLDTKLFQPKAVALSVVRSESVASREKQTCARERLEDQFRQAFLEQRGRPDMAPVRVNIGIEPTAKINGRTS